MTVECVSSNSSSLTVAIVFNIGSNNEKATQFGYTHVLEHCLLKTSQLQGIDCIIQAFTEPDHMEIRYISSINNSKELEKILRLVNSLINETNLSKSVLQYSKEEVLKEIKYANDSDTEKMRIFYELTNGLYHLPIGEKLSVENITYDAFKTFFKLYLSSCDFLLWICGNITDFTAQNLVSKVVKHKLGMRKEVTLDNHVPRWKMNLFSAHNVETISVQRIVIQYLTDLSTVENKSLQSVSDFLIEKIVPTINFLSYAMLSYKYISAQFKTLIITLIYETKNTHILELQAIVECIRQNLTDGIIECAKQEVIKWLQESRINGYKVDQIFNDRKRHYLYNEFSVYNPASLSLLISGVKCIKRQDVEQYFTNLFESPNTIYVDPNPNK